MSAGGPDHAGHDSVDEARDDHPLQELSMLWPVLGRRQLLLRLRQGRCLVCSPRCEAGTNHAQDFKVRMYDTSNPYDWKHYKTVTYPFGRWTLTDADLSPDNKWLAYTSLQSVVCLAPTDPIDTGEPYSLDLGYRNETSRADFPIYSVRFSGDGRNLVAGTGLSSIIVYDIERRERLHHVRGRHRRRQRRRLCRTNSPPHIPVSPPTPALPPQPNPSLQYSGSDDCTIKVWDTRSSATRAPRAPSSATSKGLTYLDTKGDGRYVLSNAKDQTLKLWDLRMALSTARLEELDATRITDERPDPYEYRWEDYDDRALVPAPARQLARHVPRPPRAVDADPGAFLAGREYGFAVCVLGEL